MKRLHRIEQCPLQLIAYIWSIHISIYNCRHSVVHIDNHTWKILCISKTAQCEKIFRFTFCFVNLLNGNWRIRAEIQHLGTCNLTTEACKSSYVFNMRTVRFKFYSKSHATILLIAIFNHRPFIQFN